MLFKDYFLSITSSSNPSDIDVKLPEIGGLVIDWGHSKLFRMDHDLGKSTLTVEKLNNIVVRIKKIFEDNLCNKKLYKVKTHTEVKPIKYYYDVDDNGEKYQKSLKYNKYSLETNVVNIDDFKIEFRPHTSNNEFGISFRFFIHFAYLNGNNGINLTIKNLDNIDLDIEKFTNELLTSPLFDLNKMNVRLDQLTDHSFKEMDKEINLIIEQQKRNEIILKDMLEFYYEKHDEL